MTRQNRLLNARQCIVKHLKGDTLTGIFLNISDAQSNGLACVLRFDYNGSGVIESGEELYMLTINLVSVLDVRMTMKEVEQVLHTANQESHTFTFDELIDWFEKNFIDRVAN